MFVAIVLILLVLLLMQWHIRYFCNIASVPAAVL